MHHGHSHGRCPLIGHLPREHFEQHHAQGIDIAGGGNFAAAGLLRRNIMHRAHHSLGINHGLIGHHFGNTKIGNLRIHIFIQKDILRLDIAMNDVMAVGMLQRIGQAHANFQHRVQAELMLLHIFL